MRFLCDNELRLTQSDKTGAFAVLEKSQFRAKALEAVTKNFDEASEVTEQQLKTLKTNAAKLCDDVGLEGVAKSIKGRKGLCLKPFYSYSPSGL